VVVPLEACPFTETDTPEIPLPDESVTLPLTVLSCAAPIKERSKNRGNPIELSNFLMFIAIN
jgi:hypothetical protein